MSGRPKIFDDETVVAKAAELFWTNGYRATSTEELLAVMGIGKGSFYHAFAGGKKELYEKALDYLNQAALDRFKKELAESKQPMEYIRNFFRAIAHSSEENHQKGCFLGNAIAELANVDTQLKDRAVRLLKQLEELLYETIQSAQERGEVNTQEDPALLARYLITVWNGLNISRRMYGSSKDLRPLIEIQLKIVD